jgi:hypothetical protein
MTILGDYRYNILNFGINARGQLQILSHVKHAIYQLNTVHSSGHCPSSCLLNKQKLGNVRTSQETHYVSTTSPTGYSNLQICDDVILI